jgi:ribosome-associated protein
MEPASPPPATPGIELAPRVVVPESAVAFTFSRSSGPGGQNVNKLSTKATLRVPMAAIEERIGPTNAQRLRLLLGPARLTSDHDVLMSSDESRSQHANKQACLDRLRGLLIEATRPRRVRRKTKPSRGAKERRLESKKQRGAIKRNRRGPNFD